MPQQHLKTTIQMSLLSKGAPSDAGYTNGHIWLPQAEFTGISVSVPSICHSYTGIRGSFSFFIIIVTSIVISPVNCDPDLSP